MRRIVCLTAVSLTLFLSSLMLEETFGQNVLAVKTVSTDLVRRPNAPGGWQETWGTGDADLMNVTASASQGANLLICMTARQEASALRARAFGVEISNSAGTRVSFTHLTGHIYTLTPDLVGSGCFHWSPPADDNYTFKILTFQNAPPVDLAWVAERQILVLELTPFLQNLSSLSINQTKAEIAETETAQLSNNKLTAILLEAVKELKAEVKELKNRMARLESR